MNSTLGFNVINRLGKQGFKVKNTNLWFYPVVWPGSGHAVV